MSVMVAVSIANGSAQRALTIERVTDPMIAENGHRDPDAVGTYEVIQSGGSRVLQAVFDHRYGDDYGVLIAKATEALRDRHGRI